jgi:hypothetical protein
MMILFCLGCPKVGSVQNIFFLTVHYMNSLSISPSKQAGKQAAVLGRQSHVSLCTAKNLHIWGRGTWSWRALEILTFSRQSVYKIGNLYNCWGTLTTNPPPPQPKRNREASTSLAFFDAVVVEGIYIFCNKRVNPAKRSASDHSPHCSRGISLLRTQKTKMHIIKVILPRIKFNSDTMRAHNLSSFFKTVCRSKVGNFLDYANGHPHPS